MLETDVRLSARYFDRDTSHLQPLGKSFAGWSFYYDPSSGKYVALNPWSNVLFYEDSESDLHVSLDREHQKNAGPRVCGWCDGTGIPRTGWEWRRNRDGVLELWVKNNFFEDWHRRE